jgi:hypothetical protein
MGYADARTKERKYITQGKVDTGRIDNEEQRKSEALYAGIKGRKTQIKLAPTTTRSPE